MTENIYNSNDTMRLLGYQAYSDIITPEVRSMMNDIAKARLHTVTLSTAEMDMVVLGYIIGIRTERLKKKTGNKL